MITPIYYTSFGNRMNSRINYRNTTSTYDTFTGLKDKNCLLSDLSNKMYKKENISIGMFDMDNFKSINELLGYKVGDEFIKAISDDINTVAKKHNIDAYRFGGDEFVVLLFNGTSKEDKMQIIDDIIETTSKNPIIQNRRNQYIQTAETRLRTYEQSNERVRNLLSLSAEKEILDDIYDNGTIARQDPYVQEKLNQVNQGFNNLYSSMLQECIDTEEDKRIKKSLKGKTTAQVTDYIINKFDMNHYAYRLKKWIKDFNQNGFNLTGGLATFKPSYYKGKQPIDLIDEVGEKVKESKSGKNRFYMEFV